MKSIAVFFAALIFSLCLNSNSQWVQFSSGIGNTIGISSFVVTGNNIFAGTQTGVYLSTNYGLNWTPVNNGLTLTNVTSLVYSGTSLIAGTIGAIFRSTNSGTNWTMVHSPALVRALTCNYYSRLYAAVDAQGIFMSTNDGLNWTNSSSGLTDLYIKVLSPYNHTYAGTQTSGIFYSMDGTIWSAYNQGLTNFNITALSTNTGTSFFAGTTAGVFKWVGAGTGWIAANNGLNSLAIRSLASAGPNVFAGTNNSICISTDYGQNWIVKNEGFPMGYAVNAIEIFNNYVFAGTFAQSVWRRNLNELITSVTLTSREIPETFSLFQNFPNPFNPDTKIRFSIPLLRGVSEGRGVLTSLAIYDILGRNIASLVNEQLRPGTYEVNWKASDFPSGVYFYQLTAGSYRETKKMLLVK